MKWDNLNYDELKNKCHSHEIERSINWRDQWGNWEASFGDLPYDFPFLDNLRLLEEGKKRSVWPNDAPFAICLTHDIDSITSSNHPKIALNNLSKKKYLKTGSSKLMLQYSILKQQIKKTFVTTRTVSPENYYLHRYTITSPNSKLSPNTNQIQYRMSRSANN